MPKTKILIATHKKYDIPNEDIYMPIHVGAEGKESLGYVGDNTGENISSKNSNFCELTGLYWAWKNLDVDIVGLVHYRRYFGGKNIFVVNGKKKHIISTFEIEKKLAKSDIILPKKRNYVIETLYSHYSHTMYVEPLDITGEIIQTNCPEYYPEFQKLKKRRSAHMFNMFICKKELLDKYCQWLFPILFELETKIDNSQYTSFHARFYGRVSELLLDVYLRTNKIKYSEAKLENIEKVNWGKKIKGFLKAKFKKEKYDKSF